MDIKLETRLSWHCLDQKGGPFYFNLICHSDQELLREWFLETQKKHYFGETSVSALGILSGLILGNRLTRIVQCGHYAGYSSLVLGMIIKNLNLKAKLISFDISQEMTEYTNTWLIRAGLEEIVGLHLMSSSDPSCVSIASSYLNGKPQIVFIDSAHTYRHTLNELNLWSEQVSYGGFICMHDASIFANECDPSKMGGVNTALFEWAEINPSHKVIAIDPNPELKQIDPCYKDPCGFGLIQAFPAGGSHAPEQAGIVVIEDPQFTHVDLWIADAGWQWSKDGYVKIKGESNSISCFAPVLAGKKYLVRVELADVKSGGVHPGAGGGEISSCFGSDGFNEAIITAGGTSSFIGLLATSDFDGMVLSFSAELLN
jgi:predicted O-methyltransferase YrrM